MPQLDTNIRYLAGVGEARAKSLRKLGIETLQDLVSYFPRSYEDRKLSPSISALIPGEKGAVVATVASSSASSSSLAGFSLAGTLTPST